MSRNGDGMPLLYLANQLCRILTSKGLAPSKYQDIGSAGHGRHEVPHQAKKRANQVSR